MNYRRLVQLKPTDSLSLKELISLVKPTTEIEEKILALNLIGVISGFEASIFESSDGHIAPIAGISLKNVSEQCSRSVLKRYSEYGDHISKLLQSINNYLNTRQDLGLTHLSYALTFRDIISDHVFKPLIPVCNPKSFSINHFSDFLTSSSSGHLLEKLKVLYEIDQCVANNSKSAKFILNLLTDHLYLDRIHNFNLVIQLLLSCMRPTLDYIESILTMGTPTKGEDFYFVTQLHSDANSFWEECLQIREDLPEIFNPSKDYLLLGIKSCLVAYTYKESLNYIKFPKDNLFNVFMDFMWETFGLDKKMFDDKQDLKQNLSLRFHKCDGPICSEYKYLVMDDHLEVDLHKHDFTKLDYKSSEFFLPEYYTSRGILPRLAIEHSIKLALRRFIDPINKWLTSRAMDVYLKNLNILNSFFLLQRANPEMKQYLEALFTDITDGIDKEENLNWKYYIFSDNNVQAFLSQQNLSQNSKNNFSILKNVHLVYEDSDWITRVIIDNNSKQIYDRAFRFLLQIMYARWLLERFSNHSKSLLSQKLSQSLHHLYLTRYRLLFIMNGVYNFILNNIHNSVAVLAESNSQTSDYYTLRLNFQDFTEKIERITMQRSDKFLIVKSLIKKFCELINTVWNVKNNKLDYSFLPSENEIDKFDKGFRYYLFLEDSSDDSTFTANY